MRTERAESKGVGTVVVTEETAAASNLVRPRRFWWETIGSNVLTAGVLVLVALPAVAWAHGEVHIHIAEITHRLGTVASSAGSNQLAQLYLERGELYRQDENWAAAQSDYARAGQWAPEWAKVDLCRARLAVDSGQWEAARLTLDRLLVRTPDDGEVLVVRAHLRLQLHHRLAAIEDLQRGLKLLGDPAPRDFVLLADALAAEGKSDDALRSLDEGVAKLGPIAALQTRALDLEMARQHYAGALKRVDRILAGANRKEEWLTRKGEILLVAGRCAEAQQSLHAALRAINELPSVLQTAPPMQRLRFRVNAQLAELAKPQPESNAAQALAAQQTEGRTL